MISNKILQSTVAKRLEIFRKKRKLTMSGLAERSGVSKGTLSVLEDGNGNPTISTLWSIADALEVPFSDLISLDQQNTRPQLGSDGVSVQLIDQVSTDLRIEAYHMVIQANSQRRASSHPAGVEEQVTVLQGHLLTGSLESPKLLSPGEHYTFKADCPHIYSAPTDHVSALVTVQYPKDKQLSSDYTIVKSVPSTQEEWDNLLELIDSHSLEVSNGLPIFRLVVRTGLEPEIIARNIKARLFSRQNKNYKMPVSIYFSSEKEQLCLYVFPKRKGRSYTPNKNNTLLIDQKYKKIISYTRANNITLNKQQRSQLKNIANSNNLLYASLAAEALSMRGITTLPQQLNDFIQQQNHLENKQKSIAESLLETQSNFYREDNNAYQLLRSGYMHQILSMGEILLNYSKANKGILDLGSGLSLIILLNLLPDLKITTIEPNPKIFTYWQKNLKNSAIKVQYSHLLDFDHAIKYPIIISTNASQYLNTTYFLQKVSSLLEEDGIFILSDEFIETFNSEKERNQALINHHISYMLDIINKFSCNDSDNFPPNESIFIQPYVQELPAIAFMAITCSIDAAIMRLNLLYKRVKANNLKSINNKILFAYCNFLKLELEALLAGIDYKVEHKTSAENIFTLAESSGLEVLEHQRVHATSGKSKTGGGTHVFVFKKSI